MDKVLKVRMLGTFSLEYNANKVSCDQNRSKLIWTLLAYILYNHSRTVTPNELIEAVWGDEKDMTNPSGALKTALHRARALPEPLGFKDMIVYKNGGYRIADGIRVELDTEAMEAFAKEGKWEEAVSLYGGEFLFKLSSSLWTVPVNAYYQNIYLESLSKLLPSLIDGGEYAKAESFAKEALLYLPYEESVYRSLMTALIKQEKRKEAVQVYEDFSKMLMENFGIVPAEDTKELYREALRTENRSAVSPVIINEQLKESGPIDGALVCEYEFFKMLCQAESRLIARNGNAVHIALFAVTDAPGCQLTERTTQSTMEFFGEHLRASLRKGDVISKCSPVQFAVMLPNANYENSTMVCRRVISAYKRLKPHSPAKIEFTVHPLEPKA